MLLIGLYEQQIQSAIKSVSIQSISEYTWLGLTIKVDTEENDDIIFETEEKHQPLVSNLSKQLYRYFYCTGKPQITNIHVNTNNHELSETLESNLSLANMGDGQWSQGWRADQIREHEIVAIKDSVGFLVPLSQCQFNQKHFSSETPNVTVKLPKELLGMSPGYYVALGNKEIKCSETNPVVRIYWNISSQGAILLMKGITTIINALDRAFQFKVLTDSSQFDRCDAAVLYILKEDFTTVFSALRPVYNEILSYLSPEIPMFTKHLADGLGLAEDPLNGESFGEHRCRVLAEGLVCCFEKNIHDSQDALQLIKAQYTAAGINLLTPYLSFSSEETYRVNHITTLETQSDNVKFSEVDTQSEQFKLNQIAEVIAEKIQNNAIWHNDRCTWIAHVIENNHTKSNNAILIGDLNASLYNGLAGIALFLAEVGEITGDQKKIDTALGAVKQALVRYYSKRTSPGPGLHLGWLGLGMVCARIGKLANDPTLITQARNLLHTVKKHVNDSQKFDVLGGAAGSILGALAIGSALADNAGIVLAESLANLLLQSANQHNYGYSWQAPEQLEHPDLLGYSHGTSGVAHAFIELFYYTGNERYEEAARKALEYETYWLNKYNDWPDFRTSNISKGSQHFDHQQMVAWCHGASGIGMTRIRAHEVLNDSTLAQQAVLALEKTRESILSVVDNGVSDFSYCHGLMGNAEVFLEARHRLSNAYVTKENSNIIMLAAIAGVKEFEKSGTWPGGLKMGQTPGLMLGEAGIGYFYLRMFHTNVPSIIFVEPGAWA